MNAREPKPDDQEKCQKAYKLLLDLIFKNQGEIDPSLWTGAMIGALAFNYKESDVPFKFFKKEMMASVEFYKY